MHKPAFGDYYISIILPDFDLDSPATLNIFLNDLAMSLLPFLTRLGCKNISGCGCWFNKAPRI